MSCVILTPEQRKKSVEKAKATRKRNKELKAKKQAERENEIANRALELKYNIAKLEKEVEGLIFFSNFKKFGLSNMPLPSPEAIIKEATYVELGLCGVYFLVKNDEIVYIGQSVNVFSRLAGHKDKDFDRFTYIPLPPNELDKVESFYIHTLRPKLNGRIQHNGMNMVAPMNLNDLVGVNKALIEQFNNGRKQNEIQ